MTHDIIIVDDNPANLKMLEDMLVQQGHEVRSFPRGRLALAAAMNHVPGLILLDINMPEMNGYEVCERLKSNRELANIPVIFLSALNETADKVKAFRSGAVDYISKPFQFEEVNARVETHLKLHALQEELRLRNQSLEAAVAERTRELAEANQRLTILDRSKSEFLSLLSHEFRTPLNGIFGVGEILLQGPASAEERNELREMFDVSRGRILSILDDALLLTQIDVSGKQFRSTPVSLRGALDVAMKSTTGFAAFHRVALISQVAERDLVVGDEALMVRALHALLETAVKFSHEGGAVRLTRESEADSLRLIIESEGKTIPDSALHKFFDLFSIAEGGTAGRDLGLGPAVAYRIFSLFGGLVSVANRQPSGIRLTISLKQALPNSD